jgi:hypothetical protein
MIKRHQLFRHEPHNEIYGDCHRTAIACLLDKEPWEVPHFVGELYTTSRTDYVVDLEVDKWLEQFGLFQAHIHFNGEVGLDAIFQYMRMWNPYTFYIMGGTSPRGTPHSVICRGGGFYWDPHPEGGFLPRPYTDDGLYQLTFLLPLSMRDDS